MTINDRKDALMKKRSFIWVICLMFCLLLTACGGAADDASDVQNEPVPKEPAQSVELAENPTDGAPAELAEPVMEWWELYNPNGFDTVTAVISNPNDTAIDVSYDLVFYKDGAEVSRLEYCANFDILPGHKDIIWANADIPKSTDADDVRMENVIVTQAYYTPVDGMYEYAGIVDNEAMFDFAFDSKPTLATIWFLLYNDNNGNGQFDKGEIVGTSVASLMEQTGRVSFETDVSPYTDYEVFFTAYE